MNFNIIPDNLRLLVLDYINNPDFDDYSRKHDILISVDDKSLIVIAPIITKSKIPFCPYVVEGSHDNHIIDTFRVYVNEVINSKGRPSTKTIRFNFTDSDSYEIMLVPYKKSMESIICINTEIDKDPVISKLLKIISQKPGITQSEISNRSRSLSISLRNKLLQEMINSNIITCELQNKSKISKKTRRYTAVNPVTEADNNIEPVTEAKPVFQMSKELQQKLSEIESVYKQIEEIPDSEFKNINLSVISKRVFPLLEKLLPHFPGEKYIIQIDSEIYKSAEHGLNELFIPVSESLKKLENSIIAGNFRASKITNPVEFGFLIHHIENIQIYSNNNATHSRMAEIISNGDVK